MPCTSALAVLRDWEWGTSFAFSAKLEINILIVEKAAKLLEFAQYSKAARA
jgi:hypothetical protein